MYVSYVLCVYEYMDTWIHVHTVNDYIHMLRHRCTYECVQGPYICMIIYYILCIYIYIIYIYICLYMHAQEQVHMCIYECLGVLYIHDYIVCIIYAYYMCICICLHMHAQELYIRVFRGPIYAWIYSMYVYYIYIYICLHTYTQELARTWYWESSYHNMVALRHIDELTCI
jgi:hypothetical protein